MIAARESRAPGRPGGPVAHRTKSEVGVQRKQNLTVKLDKSIIHKAKTLAARRGTSVSGLVAAHIEEMVGDAEAFEAAHRTALAFLDQGFHLGGRIRCTRDELHGR